MSDSLTTPEDLLGPPRVDLISMGLASIASFVSWAIGGIFILISTFLFLSTAQIAAPAIFPYMLALVAFVAVLISLYSNFYFQKLIFPNKYQWGSAQATQTFLFCLLLYIAFNPLYLFVGGNNTEFLVIVFTFHVLVASLGTTLLIEMLSNYRYSILAVYASFLGFFVASAVTAAYFMTSSLSESILFSLAAILAIVMVIQTVFRTLFEFVYFKIYEFSGQDILWSLFAQIQKEESDLEQQAEKQLTQFK